MALINRQTLKNYFKKGGVPSEKHFVDLIDSSLNVIDDGISITPKHGFKINPLGYSSRLMSFFKQSTQSEPEFSIELNKNDLAGLSIHNKEDESLLKIKSEGFIGINTENPKLNLEVAGSFGSKTRVGVFAKGTVEGDGLWHTIVPNLNGLNGFEIVAYIRGKEGSGRYALSHAIALSTFGGRFSKSRIKASNSYYGSFFNKLSFRWYGTMNNYNLQVRTKRHYGINPETAEVFKINYNITQLFTE